MGIEKINSDSSFFLSSFSLYFKNTCYMEIINCLKSHSSELTHYRPVPLTSIIMKCFEKLLQNIIFSHFWIVFSLNTSRKEDGLYCLLQCLLQHLDTPGNQARLLLIDFNSAFNSIQRHQVIKKLSSITTNSLNRLQVVKWTIHYLPPLFLILRAPQGCVLSPFLILSIQMTGKVHLLLPIILHMQMAQLFLCCSLIVIMILSKFHDIFQHVV